MSAPLRPAARTATSASPVPGVGSGRSSTTTCWSGKVTARTDGSCRVGVRRAWATASRVGVVVVLVVVAGRRGVEDGQQLLLPHREVVHHGQRRQPRVVPGDLLAALEN